MKKFEELVTGEKKDSLYSNEHSKLGFWKKKAQFKEHFRNILHFTFTRATNQLERTRISLQEFFLPLICVWHIRSIFIPCFRHELTSIFHNCWKDLRIKLKNKKEWELQLKYIICSDWWRCLQDASVKFSF